jgi:hypothetical protein
VYLSYSLGAKGILVIILQMVETRRSKRSNSLGDDSQHYQIVHATKSLVPKKNSVQEYDSDDSDVGTKFRSIPFSKRSSVPSKYWILFRIFSSPIRVFIFYCIVAVIFLQLQELDVSFTKEKIQLSTAHLQTQDPSILDTSKFMNLQVLKVNHQTQWYSFLGLSIFMILIVLVPLPGLEWIAYMSGIAVIAWYVNHDKYTFREYSATAQMYCNKPFIKNEIHTMWGFLTSNKAYSLQY